MPTNTNLSKFDQMHIDLKSLEWEQARLQFLFDQACSLLKFEHSEFLRTLEATEVIDASAWKQISALFDELQKNLIPGKRTFKADVIENKFYELGIGGQQHEQLIHAIYFTHQWPDVCYQYARDFGTNPDGEIGEIIMHFERIPNQIYAL